MPEYMEITDIADDFLICRTLGHSWDDNPGAVIDSEWEPYSTGVITLRCTRCTAERFDYIGNANDVVHRYYRYPDHYTTIPGTASKPNLRGELFRRSLLINAWQRRNGHGRRASS